MQDKMMRFMAGRYGSDPLNQFLMIAALILVLASSLWQPLYALAIALLALGLFRMFSRNAAKRQAEYMAFERVTRKPVGFFKTAKNLIFGTKAHRFYRCPECRQQVRVPRGKGKISIHCPKCQASFKKRT